MESVLERGQGAFNFLSYYESLCAIQSSVPLASVKANLDHNVIEVNADKIRHVDWLPILKAISINKSLVRIAFYSSYRPSSAEDDTDNGVSPASHRKLSTPSQTAKIPAVFSKQITYDICMAIRDCLTVSESLLSIELNGLTLRHRDVHQLSKGIYKCLVLRELSLEASSIGDGLTVLCESLKNASTVSVLNLSECNLADGAAPIITRVVKHQGIMRHNEAWKSSLRYRAPDLDCMPGLRRVSLNRNPLLSDAAAFSLAEALKDDLWLKALDIQECGITDTGAEALLEALRLNSTLLILDIRGNHLVNHQLIDRIIQQVLINADGKPTTFEWMKLGKKEMKYVSRTRVPRKEMSKMSKTRTHIVSPHRIHAWTSEPSTVMSAVTPQSVPRQRGLPWRTAERANAQRSVLRQQSKSVDNTPRVSIRARSPTIRAYSSARATSHSLDYDPRSEILLVHSDSEDSQSSNKENPHSISLMSHKQLQAENISLKRRLADESAARLAAEDRALELARENRRMRSELRHSSASGGDGGGGADEELLSKVETAFRKFDQFLDLVRDTGLGHLIEEAGLGYFNSASSPIPMAPAGAAINRSGLSYSGTGSADPANSALSFSEYVMDRQIALQSDDIIKPTADCQPPKKSYPEIVAAGPKISLATTIPPPLPQPSPPDDQVDHSNMPPQKPPTEHSQIFIKSFDLHDVSELDTPKLTPRGANSTTERTSDRDTVLRASTEKSMEELPSRASGTEPMSKASAHDYDSDDFTADSESKKSGVSDLSKTVTLSKDSSLSYSKTESDVAGDNKSDSDDGGALYSNIRSLSELGSSTDEVDKTAGLDP